MCPFVSMVQSEYKNLYLCKWSLFKQNPLFPSAGKTATIYQVFCKIFCAIKNLAPLCIYRVSALILSNIFQKLSYIINSLMSLYQFMQAFCHETEIFSEYWWKFSETKHSFCLNNGIISIHFNSISNNLFLCLKIRHNRVTDVPEIAPWYQVTCVLGFVLTS